MAQHSEFGKRLKSEREKLGLTQQQLARKFGVDKSSIYLYERGDRTPPATHLMVLAELGADVSFLINGRPIGSAVHDEWLHRTMDAIRDLMDTGAWGKLDWDERERLVARLIRAV